jgi:hypothetical protein
MPYEVYERPPRGPRPKYPWEKWVHELREKQSRTKKKKIARRFRRHVEYECTTKTFAEAAMRYSRENGHCIVTQQDHENEAVVISLKDK